MSTAVAYFYLKFKVPLSYVEEFDKLVKVLGPTNDSSSDECPLPGFVFLNVTTSKREIAKNVAYYFQAHHFVTLVTLLEIERHTPNFSEKPNGDLIWDDSEKVEWYAL
jgi:hypothetical protein